LAVHLGFKLREERKHLEPQKIGLPKGRRLVRTRKLLRFLIFTREYVSDLPKVIVLIKRGLMVIFLLFFFLADKKFTRKPPRFSCLLPDPRELTEIKNKKKVHAYIAQSSPCAHPSASPLKGFCPRG
jgi:hypothetical protein